MRSAYLRGTFPDLKIVDASTGKEIAATSYQLTIDRRFPAANTIDVRVEGRVLRYALREER